MNIHSTAVVEPGASLGENVTVGPFAYIAGNVQIGSGCMIGPHAVMHPFTSVGSGCRIHACAVIGDLPQDLAFKEQESYVKIGANCVIREGVTIHRGTKPGTSTVVGDGCFLMVNSHLAHNVQMGNNVILANGVLLAGYAEIGERVFFSGNSMVHQFARVGRLAMLGGGSGAAKDVPPFCTLRPITLNRVVGLNVVGMRRAGMGSKERLEVKKAYKLVFRSGLNVSQAVEAIKQEFKEGPALDFALFIEASKRGICAASRTGESDEEE